MAVEISGKRAIAGEILGGLKVGIAPDGCCGKGFERRRQIELQEFSTYAM